MPFRALSEETIQQVRREVPVMKRSPSGTLVREIDILYQVGTIGGVTDRELLGHFTTRESVAAQHAFEAIVHRHGPMVLGGLPPRPAR
jgi:hypothetical protein